MDEWGPRGELEASVKPRSWCMSILGLWSDCFRVNMQGRPSSVSVAPTSWS